MSPRLSAPAAAESELVFNVVFTPGTFRYLSLFTRSLLANTSASLRIVANGCERDEVASMRAFAVADPARVEVRAAPETGMMKHGAVLEHLYGTYDDGDYFCFIDSDVIALHPFVAELLAFTPEFAVVTTGDVAWSDDRVLPDGATDLVGRHAIGADGFAYGSSYVAVYERYALEATRARWPITFQACAHSQLAPSVRERIASVGRVFELYDTAKALNLVLAGEGFRIQHFDNSGLYHLGGISQYLSYGGADRDSAAPWFATSQAGSVRWEFAKWAACALSALVDGGNEPALPETGPLAAPASAVLHELRDLVDRYA